MLEWRPPTRQSFVLRVATSGAVMLSVALLISCRNGGESPDSPSTGPAAESYAFPEPAAMTGFNLLLITVDTLRADALGAYGDDHGATPRLDELAAGGVRFESAFAHATMTLPSHASILTGQYPFAHGVRDNGAFRLDDSRLTLAEVLHDAGYATAAFVGAFVLDRRFGLGQGFDHYDDDYGASDQADDFHFVERRADQVLAPATTWVEQQDGRWFAWVHLFDPHVPYEAPDPFGARFPDEPYRGEVAYVDQALGDALDRLAETGALDDTLIVLTADHGESLGEHGERTHGVFAYNATLRVPLIMAAGQALEPGVFAAPVGHVDIVPSVLELLGVEIPDTAQGRSLLAYSSPTAINEPRPRPGGSALYFESLNGYLTQNLAPLTGIVEGDYKFIELPLPELYNLAEDPAEQHNLYLEQPATATALRATLADLQAAAGAGSDDPLGDLRPAAMDAATRSRLEALGYLTPDLAPENRGFTVADDPKSTIDVIERYRSAMAARADPAAVIRQLGAIVEERPSFTAASLSLSSVLYDTDRLDDAIAILEAAVTSAPQNMRALGRLGSYLAFNGELERAAGLQEAAMEGAPDDIDLIASLGVTYGQMGRADDARAMFARVLELDPSSAGARYNLGMTYLRESRLALALDQFRSAIELDPNFWLAHEGLGGALIAANQPAEAANAWKRSLEINPQSFDTLYNLGIVLAQLARRQEALEYLDRFVREAPSDRYADDIETIRALAAQLRQASS
ncbi:MAG: tetratricopeptide repeat protein [Acidobacteria bacterium]|nr:MAG: tetratricopeptide repeat protein [Acidobacteriota bacterium]